MKKLNVFSGKEYLRDIYPHATRFECFKFKVRTLVRNFLRLFTLSTVIGSAIMIAFLIGFNSRDTKADTVYVDTFEQKIDGLKDDVVQEILSCESAGYKETDGIIIFDTNNKASIGQLQFQKNTVVYYYKSLYGESITPKEATMIALDTDKAKELAKDIIFKTDKGLTNWINCSNKFNSKVKVEVIKKLEKS